MNAHIRKWGNSLAIRIPRAFASEAGFVDGTAIELTLEGGKLVAAPRRASRASLPSLVARIRPAQMHRETVWDGPAGKESW